VDAVTSSWNPPATAPIPLRAIRTPTPARANGAGFLTQLGLGLAIFVAVLAAALPLALVSEGLALGAAVGVGAVLVALLACRLRIALMIATLLAVLGAFPGTHSVHLAMHETTVPIRLAELAPASGAEMRGDRAQPMPAVVVMPVRAELGGASLSLAGWAFPGALFALWAIGFAALRLSRACARWLLQRLGRAG
jgi:hypothetical protein